MSQRLAMMPRSRVYVEIPPYKPPAEPATRKRKASDHGENAPPTKTKADNKKMMRSAKVDDGPESNPPPSANHGPRRFNIVEVVIERKRPVRAPPLPSPPSDSPLSPPQIDGRSSPSPSLIVDSEQPASAVRVALDVDVGTELDVVADVDINADGHAGIARAGPITVGNDNAANFDAGDADVASQRDTPVVASTSSRQSTPSPLDPSSSSPISLATPTSAAAEASSSAPARGAPYASALSFVSPPSRFGKKYRIERADAGWMRDLGFVPILGGGYYTCPPSESCTECTRLKQPCNIAPLRIAANGNLRRLECQACSRMTNATCSASFREYAASRVLSPIATASPSGGGEQVRRSTRRGRG